MGDGDCEGVGRCDPLNVWDVVEEGVRVGDGEPVCVALCVCVGVTEPDGVCVCVAVPLGVHVAVGDWLDVGR